MSNTKNTENEPLSADETLIKLSDRYLDLWQDNIRYWASDPDAFEKWFSEAEKMISPSVQKTP